MSRERGHLLRRFVAPCFSSPTGIFLAFVAVTMASLCCPSSLPAFQANVGGAAASGPEGARIFPESTNLYLQIESPAELIDKILEHPLRAKIESLEPVQQALKSPEMTQGKIGLAFLETQIGEEWLPAIKTLTGGGVYVGADLRRQSVGIAFQSTDEALLKTTAGAVLGFVKQQSGGEAFEIESYRDGKFADFDNLIVARFGKWFIVSNQADFARDMADNLLDGVVAGKSVSDTLANNELFRQARSAVAGVTDAWGYLDLETLRSAGVAPELFEGSTDNPGVELLFGGLLEGLEDAAFATSHLKIDDASIGLSATLPFDSSSIQSPREFFFGNRAAGRAPAPIELPGLLAQAVTYRDLGRWWLSKEELFPENIIAGLAQTDSQLSTFFGGADFGEEILGSLQPGLRIVVKGQDYQKEMEPDIKIPAFALIGRLQNPSSQRVFKRAFQSLVTFLNLDANADRPQLDMESTRENGYAMTGAQYWMEDDSEPGLIAYNFSPAIAFQDDYMIVASTIDLARELAIATRNLDDETNVSDSNTLLTMNAATIKQQLVINREALIAQSMVGSGKTRDQSIAEIDLALSLLDYASQARIDYRVETGQMVLDIELDLQPN